MGLQLGIGLGLIPTAARPAATTAPVNVVKPFFEGPLTQGQSAAVNPGSWTGLPSPNFTYAIKRGATTVSTDPAYVWTSADVAAGAGAMTVAVTATNDIGPTSATSDPVTIAATLQLAGTPATAMVGSTYSFVPARVGGHGPYVFALTGTLPTGLSFNPATGAITGTPVASGTSSLTIGVTDVDGLTATLGPFNLVVSVSTTVPSVLDEEFTATAARQTGAIANGIYSCLLSGGDGGARWQYVGVSFGMANVTDQVTPGATFDRIRLYGPHAVAPAASGIYGPKLRYYMLAGSAGVWEGGSSYSQPVTLVGGANNISFGPNISPVHQGVALTDPEFVYSLDNGNENGVRKRNRDSTWSEVVGFANTVISGHVGAGKCYAGTIINGASSYTKTLVLPTETYGGSAGSSSNFRIRILDTAQAGLPEVKTLVVPLTAGVGGDEMSGLAIRESDGAVFIFDFHAQKVHRTTIASINATADGGTITMLSSWTFSTLFERCQGGFYDPATDTIWLSVQLVSPGSGNVFLVLDANTGKEVGHFRMNGSSAGGREGVDIDAISGKIGVLFDDSGTTNTSVVNFWDKPSLSRNYSAGGMTLNEDVGLSFPNVKLDGSYSFFGVEVPTTGNATPSTGGAATRQGRLAHTGSGATFFHQISSGLQMEYRIPGATGAAIPTAAVTTGQRWVWGGNYDNAATPLHQAYSYVGNADGTSAVTANFITGSAAKTTFPTISRAGIVPNFTQGRPKATLGLVAIFGDQTFTQAQFDAMRDNPTLLFDVTDPMDPAQKAAIDGSSSSDAAVTFGALTRAGVGGGIPTTATGITSGDAEGHFQVTSGTLCVSAIGDAANLGGGPRLLVMNDGSTVSINIEDNCWSCSTQAEWDFLISQSAAALSGKTIRVRRLPGDGVYASGVDGAAARLRRADYGGLVIKGDDTSIRPHHEDDISASSMPIFDRWVLRGARNLAIYDTDTPPATGTKFLIIGESANTAGGIIIQRNRVRGKPIDPQKPYDGRVANEQIGVGDGVTTTFPFTLQYTPYNGSTNIAPHAQGVAIVAGAVTGTNGGSGSAIAGAGVASGTISYVTGAGSVIYSAAPANGEPLYASYNSPRFFFPSEELIVTNVVTTGLVGPLDIIDNHITWGRRGLNVAVGVGYLKLTGNRIKYYYEDGANVSYGGTDIPTTIADNVISHAMSKGSDVGNPHNDGLRLAAAITAMTDMLLYLWRNRIFRGKCRVADGGAEMQGVLASDFTTSLGDSGRFFTGEAIGNLICVTTTQGLSIENAKDFIAANNTVIGNTPLAGTSTGIKIGAGSTYSTSSGIHRLERNVADGTSVGGSPALAENRNLGTAGVSTGYATIFAGPTFNPDTLDELMAFVELKAGGPGEVSGGPPHTGAVGSGAVTWATNVPGSDGVNHVS